MLKHHIQKKCFPYRSCKKKKKRLIIYFNKFQTSNLIIFNNFSLCTERFGRTNVVYIF